jgi:hypothetical protein
MTDPPLTDVLGALSDILRELTEGTPSSGGYVLNPSDPGLLASLDQLSAAEASTIAPGAATTMAAHVDHVRYGLSLFNRWSNGERNPFATATWAESWKRTKVSDAAWVALREQLSSEVHAWTIAIKLPRPLDAVALRGVIASVVHLAYHVGAMRQMDQRLRGPREKG